MQFNELPFLTRASPVRKLMTMSQRKIVSETTLKMILWLYKSGNEGCDQPAGGEVIVEEGDGDGEDDEVGDEQKEHADVPIES